MLANHHILSCKRALSKSSSEHLHSAPLARALATLSDVQEAAKRQALRQGLSSAIIKKIDYDFSFSDRTEGERTTIKKLEA